MKYPTVKRVRNILSNETTKEIFRNLQNYGFGTSLVVICIVIFVYKINGIEVSNYLNISEIVLESISLFLSGNIPYLILALIIIITLVKVGIIKNSKAEMAIEFLILILFSTDWYVFVITNYGLSGIIAILVLIALFLLSHIFRNRFNNLTYIDEIRATIKGLLILYFLFFIAFLNFEEKRK